MTGTLAAEELVMLSLKVTGRLEEVLVDLGAHVQRGQVLARLKPTTCAGKGSNDARRSCRRTATVSGRF